NTRKMPIADVAVEFVGRLGSEDPRVAAQEAVFRGLQVQQRKAQPIQAPGSRSPDAVIQHQPPAGCLDERWRQSHTISVPPGPAPGRQYELVSAPVTEIWREGDPDVRARIRQRAMTQCESPVAP